MARTTDVLDLLAEAHSPEICKPRALAEQATNDLARIDRTTWREWRNAKAEADDEAMLRDLLRRAEAVRVHADHLPPKANSTSREVFDQARKLERAFPETRKVTDAFRKLAWAMDLERDRNRRQGSQTTNLICSSQHRGRERRPGSNTRARGSRRVTSRSAGGGSSGDDPHPSDLAPSHRRGAR
jgi:hypothetical protein